MAEPMDMDIDGPSYLLPAVPVSPEAATTPAPAATTSQQQSQLPPRDQTPPPWGPPRVRQAPPPPPSARKRSYDEIAEPAPYVLSSNPPRHFIADVL